uniref:CD209 antigen-like protein A n=1 Tax=Epinephelus lanceolatus TaxID=310571 RepID=UPI0014471C14|nr:CD209 antigen-like protein A [Epinephelus lanceolatus]
MYGGDLAVIDSKDKEKATVNHLLDNNKYRPNPTMGLWIGLKNFPKEDTWRWVDGRALVEGYWGDGEPNSNKQGDSDCGVVHAKENFFKAWNDVRCGQKQKWICEKAPNYTT